MIQGQLPCNGAFLRANPDGSDLELYVWGLRSDFGYRFSGGQLFASQNSANPIPPRPIHDDWETIWEVRRGAWYGWPDYYSGLPITHPRFRLKGSESVSIQTDPLPPPEVIGARIAPPGFPEHQPLAGSRPPQPVLPDLLDARLVLAHRDPPAATVPPRQRPCRRRPPEHATLPITILTTCDPRARPRPGPGKRSPPTCLRGAAGCPETPAAKSGRASRT